MVKKIFRGSGHYHAMMPVQYSPKNPDQNDEQARIIVQLAELGQSDDLEIRLQDFLASYAQAGHLASGWGKLADTALALERLGAAAVFATQQCESEPDNSHYAYNLGLVLTWAGRQNEAQDVARGLIERHPREDTGYQLMLDCLQMSGDWQSMPDWWAKLAANEEARLADHPLGRKGMRFLNQNHGILHRFGETATQLDPFVKMQKLGWLPAEPARLIAPTDVVANNSYLDYWSEYVDLVRDPAEIDGLIDLATELRIHTRFFRTPDGQFVSKMQGQAAVQQAWQQDARPPLLTLRPDHVADGRETMKRIGLPEDAWFTCLHVREPGYLKSHEAELHAFRDADIETYLPAVEAITQAGGYVVRLGDPSMQKLPPLKNVIDYAHSELRGDWLDVYLLGAARFVLGTTSGPTPVAATFGTPVVMTNMVPHGERGPNLNSLFLPKIYTRHDGRPLSFSEMMEGPNRWLWNGGHLANGGLKVIDNTANEIRDVTLEMMARLNGMVTSDPADEKRQDGYKALFNRSDDFDTGSRIGQKFIEEHEGLL
jgi:putative glycosyltransferase (TIGR04372 family)